MEPHRDTVRLRLASKPEMLQLAERGNLYAVIDACGEPAVSGKSADAGPRARCLYQGEAEAKHKDLAPHLFQVDAKTLDWIEQELADKPWGMFATTRADLAGLARHLRSMLLVKDPKGAELYFRFYDPRVLEAYLGQCTNEELLRFYGPVMAYGLYGPGPGECTFRVSNLPPAERSSVAPIQIRQEQMSFFDAKISREMEDRTCGQLREKRGAGLDKVSDEELHRRVGGYMKDGRQYGITREPALALYAESRLKDDLAKPGPGRR